MRSREGAFGGRTTEAVTVIRQRVQGRDWGRNRVLDVESGCDFGGATDRGRVDVGVCGQCDLVIGMFPTMALLMRAMQTCRL